ncbi:MAG: hypothetical protein A2X18_01500 [Bacteroidetes bacterium GWF2_40_14]|nr:MAG: hypothetical protein A2X18_01500 [Bacteroidetes bacterium GWF2_40_14]
MRGRFLLAGTLAYFLVTFLFYTTMAMYNIMFMAFVSLLAFSFFALLTTMFSFDTDSLPGMFSARTPVRFAGGFLIFTSISIALFWLSIIVPPLIDGSVYPDSLDHYTTLIVQGMDLGLLLPIAFVSALLLIKRRPLGYLFAPTYLVFLSILMTALTAKIIAMAINGVNVVPAVFIIPLFNILSLICVIMLLKNININISNK